MTTANEHPTELISALIDGELAPEERTQLEAHLAGCAICGALVADLRLLRAALVDEEVPPTPVHLAARIGRDIRSVSAAAPRASGGSEPSAVPFRRGEGGERIGLHPPRQRRPFLYSWRLPAAASIAASGLLALVLLRQERPGAVVTEMPATAESSTLASGSADRSKPAEGVGSGADTRPGTSQDGTRMTRPARPERSAAKTGMLEEANQGGHGSRHAEESNLQKKETAAEFGGELPVMPPGAPAAVSPAPGAANDRIAAQRDEARREAGPEAERYAPQPPQNAGALQKDAGARAPRLDQYRTASERGKEQVMASPEQKAASERDGKADDGAAGAATGEASGKSGAAAVGGGEAGGAPADDRMQSRSLRQEPLEARSAPEPVPGDDVLRARARALGSCEGAWLPIAGIVPIRIAADESAEAVLRKASSEAGGRLLEDAGPDARYMIDVPVGGWDALARALQPRAAILLPGKPQALDAPCAVIFLTPRREAAGSR